MADRYWRGGTGTWNTTSTTNWSTTSGGSGGASVPTAADNVIFDQAATYNVTMTGALACLNITVSAGTVSFLTGTGPTLQINGSMSLAGVTWTSTGAITFNSTTTGQTITTGGTTINASITFNGVGGEWSLGSALTTGATQTTTLTNGSLVLNGYDLTTGIFSSTNTNTRSIAFGANNIILAHTTSAQTVLSMAIATGFTYTSSGTFASGTGTFQATMSTTRTFVFGTTGGSITNAPRLYLVSGASVATITTGSWWSEIHFGTCSFTIAATNQNLSSLVSNNSTSNLVALTATMVGTGTIATNTTIGPLVINNGASSGTTTLYSGTTTCTTCTLTSGTFDNAGQTLTCSSTFTWTSGSLINISALNCTIFTLNGPTFDFTGGTITPSTSFVVTSGSFTYNGGALGAVPTFTHTAGTVQFNYSYSLTATGTYTFTAGTLSIYDGVTLSTGIFSSSNANARTINFGTIGSPGYIALTHTTAATVVLNIAIMTGLTVNALGKFALVGQQYWTQNAGGFVSNTSVTKTFTCGTTGGNSANAPCLTVVGTGATQLPTFTTASWFGDFNILSLETMTIAATTLNVNSYLAQGYYYSLNTTSMNLNFVGSGVITNESDTSNTFGILGAVTINHSGTTSMVYSSCAATTVALTAGTLECRFWANGPFNGYGQFILTGAFTQTGGSWYNNAVYIGSCTTYTINGPTISFDSGSITVTTGMTLTTGSFTFNGGTLASVPLFTHTAGTVTIKTNQTASLTATGTYTFTSGSLIIESPIGLDTGLYTGIFSSSGTGVRSITFGQTAGAAPAFINLTHTTPGTTVLSMATVTNFTWTAAYDPAINVGDAGFKSDMVNTRTFVFGTTGGSITNSPNLLFSGASTPTITTGSWFNILNFYSAQTFTLPATSLNLNSIIPGSGYGTISLANLTANMRGPGFLDAGSSLGAVVINNGSNVTQVRTEFFPPNYGASYVQCTTLTITAGTLDGGIQTFTGSCTAGVLTTVGSPTLVPGSVIYSSTVGSGPVSYVGIILSGSGNSWLLTTPSTSFVSATLATNCSQFYSPPAGITCSGAVTWTGGSLTNFGSTTAYVYGSGINSLLLTCTTFTVNGPTFNHTLQNGGTINPSTSFVLTSGSYTLNGGVLGAVPLFTHTAGTVTFNYNYSLTTTGTYTLTAGTLTLPPGITLATGIFSSTGAGTRSIGFGASIVSGAAAFNGVDQYLTVPSSTALTLGTGDFTVEAWINPITVVSGTNQFNIITLGSLQFYVSDGTLYFYDATQNAGGGTVVINKWQHVALTRAGTLVTAYINGVSYISTTSSVNFVVATTLIATNSDPGGTRAWGYISNLRVVKGVAVYTGAFTVPASPLAATQSSGTNISAITGTQTSLLLNTVNGAGFLTDSSTYNATVTNNGVTTSSSLNPFAGYVNLTHTTAATVVLNMAALGGFTYTGIGGFTVADMANTRTLSVGNTSGGSLTTAPNLYFTSGASIPTITTAGWFNNLDFGFTSFAIAATALNITGDLTLSLSGTYTSLTATLRDTGTATLITNGKTIAALTVNGPAGVFTLAGILTVTGALTLTAGTVNTAYAITSASFASAGPYSRSIVGPTTYTISGAGATAWNFSSTGSVLFNGSTQYLTVPDNAAFVFTGDFTMEAWIYPTSFGGTNGNAIAAHWPGAVATDCAWIFQITSTGKVSLAYGIGATNTTVTGTSLSCSLNVWNHVAVTRSGSTVKFFVNGVADATTPTVSGSLNDSTAVVSIGRINATDLGYFSGYITNVRLVKGVAVYTGNFTVPTAPLLPTQSSGTNISAITGTQTSLLLSTPSTSFLTDYSTNAFTVTNTGTATANILSPFAVTSPGITFTGFTISMTSASAKTFAGGGATYPVLNNGGAGALTISGSNTFETISNSVQPTTFTFTINTTQTVNNFNVAGIPGSLVTINSSTATTAATLSKASGTVYGSYLSIRDSTATGGATWYAGPTSTNTSNNTGWIFNRLPIVTFGNLTVTGGGLTVSDSAMVF